MDRLSRIPRASGLLLLGLALGLLWVAVSFLTHHDAAHAEDRPPAEDGLLGVVTQSVPALTGVTEAVESAVHSTNAVLTATVEELPPLGHLPVVEAVAPIVEHPALAVVVEPAVALLEELGPRLAGLVSGVGEVVSDDLLEASPQPGSAALADAPAVAPAASSPVRIGAEAIAPQPDVVAEAEPGDAAEAPEPFLPSDGLAAPAAAGNSGGAASHPACADAGTGSESAAGLGGAPPGDDQVPPGPTYSTDTTPD